MKEENAMMSARRCCSGSCEPLLSLLFVPLEDSRLRKTLNGKQHSREDPWTRNREYTSFIHYALLYSDLKSPCTRIWESHCDVTDCQLGGSV